MCRAPSASTSTSPMNSSATHRAHALRRSAGTRTARRRSAAAPRTSRESASGAPAASPWQKTRAASARRTAAPRAAAASPRALAQHPDHLLVTEVDAVESADREHATAMPPDAGYAGPERAPSRPRAPNRSPDARHYRGSPRRSGFARRRCRRRLQPELPGPHAEQPQARRNRRRCRRRPGRVSQQDAGAGCALASQNARSPPNQAQQGRHRRARDHDAREQAAHDLAAAGCMPMRAQAHVEQPRVHMAPTPLVSASSACAPGDLEIAGRATSACEHEQVQRHRHAQGAHRDAHRALRVLARVVARSRAL